MASPARNIKAHSEVRSDLPIPPGEHLAEMLEATGWTQSDLAARMGRPVQVVNQIIHGKKAITAETALQLEAVLGVSAEFWMNLESNYRLTLARSAAGAGERDLAYEVMRVWVEENKSDERDWLVNFLRRVSAMSESAVTDILLEARDTLAGKKTFDTYRRNLKTSPAVLESFIAFANWQEKPRRAFG